MAHDSHQAAKTHHDNVRIHIDQHPYESPNPTTGEALYELGKVRPGLELYREVGGKREDKPVRKNKEHVHLRQDEHFHSGEPQPFEIFVNGRQKEVTADVVSFEEIVKLANLPSTPDTIFTVTFKHGIHNQEGSLVAGQKVEIRDGMIFNVTPTNKS